MWCARPWGLEVAAQRAYLRAMTAQATPLGLPDPVREARFYAGVAPRRLLAFALDTAAIAVLGPLAAALFGVLTLGAGFLAAGPVALGVAFVYRAAALARLSATPGMWALGLKLREVHGGPLAPWTATAHTALFFICFFIVLPQFASVWLMAAPPSGRGLPDRALGCAMIHRPA